MIPLCTKPQNLDNQYPGHLKPHEHQQRQRLPLLAQFNRFIVMLNSTLLRNLLMAEFISSKVWQLFHWFLKQYELYWSHYIVRGITLYVVQHRINGSDSLTILEELYFQTFKKESRSMFNKEYSRVSSFICVYRTKKSFVKLQIVGNGTSQVLYVFANYPFTVHNLQIYPSEILKGNKKRNIPAKVFF